MLEQMCLIVNKSIIIEHVIGHFCANFVFQIDQKAGQGNDLQEGKHLNSGVVTDGLLEEMPEEYRI